jgi:hypothetical protein
VIPAMRRSMVAAAGVTFALLVVGCSTPQPGTAQPVETPQAQTTSKAPTTGKSTKPSTSANAVDPCALLSSSEASSLGFGVGKPDDVGGRKTCNWGSSGSEGILIGLGKTSLEQLHGQTVDVGKHQAAKLPETQYGGCSIALALPDKSNVTVVATPPAGQANDTACPKALNVAKIIDPKLP